MTPEQKWESLQQVAGDVSRETFERLLTLETFFLRWAKIINLAAPESLEETWTRHILDSAQLVRFRPDQAGWVDLGSGGGFPGLVLAAFLPSCHPITLVESNQKKASYLRNAAAALKLPARVQVGRVEELRLDQVETISARAFAPLARLFAWSTHLWRDETVGLLHKGRGYQAELEAVRDDWLFDLVIHQSRIDSDSVILEIRSLRRR